MAGVLPSEISIVMYDLWFRLFLIQRPKYF